MGDKLGCLLGIDVGTTNIKAVVYDRAAGRILSTSRRPNTTHHPRTEWSDFYPDEVWQAVSGAIRDALVGAGEDARVEAVSVASMGEAGVPIGENGEALYPIIAWYDGRADRQADTLAAELGREQVFRITGHHVRNIYSALKILWLRENQPDVFQNMRHWLCIEDYIIWKLAGTFATDFTVASRTMLFDQARKDWSDLLLSYAGIGREQLPVIHSSGEVVGRVTKQAAASTGLKAGTPVVTGGHDHLCGALGVGITMPGSMLDSTGTAQALLTLVDDCAPSAALYDAGYTIYRYVLPEYCVVQGGSSTSGASVMWLSRLLAGGAEGSVSADLMAQAAGAPLGSMGLFWLPHFLGSGTPENDERSKGALVGLTTSHDKPHVLRAILEGLSYWDFNNLEHLGPALGVEVHEVVAIGGATRYPLWMQIKADVTGRTITVPDAGEAAAVGAALLAGTGAGVFPDGKAAADSLKWQSTVYQPRPEAHSVYQRLYADVYSRLYPALKEINARIHEEFWSGE